MSAVCKCNNDPNVLHLPFLGPPSPPSPLFPALVSPKLGRNEHTASLPLKNFAHKERGEDLMKYLDVLHKLFQYDIVGILPPFRSLNFRGDGPFVCPRLQ